MTRTLLLVVAALGLLLAGAATGIAAVALHTRGWGFALVVVASLATLLALPAGWSTRVAFALGWEVPVLRAGLATGPGGDVVVSGDLAGYALLVLALVVALAAMLTLPARRRTAAPAPSEESCERPASA
ncbi:hypothetical protein [Nocardioides sp. CFH 31398]|uniref:hypothetical protein n=1 Tax=Nocardioides sp. CFH 31398 TaxID=2919579 RepID=UPI001F06EB67|nr:hypothetical protein [Nocardioides sp. CFH 31398]MCH1868052.1 hypothetical protein [Nocardioides sp. CFH 31398]